MHFCWVEETANHCHNARTKYDGMKRHCNGIQKWGTHHVSHQGKIVRSRICLGTSKIDLQHNGVRLCLEFFLTFIPTNTLFGFSCMQ